MIDTKVIFAPTAAEAVGIAITDGDDTSRLISEYCIKLGVSNIRVIKKIERLVRMVTPLVAEFDPAITRQVVHSIGIFGWCKFDAGARPPPLEYLKVSSLARYVDRKEGQHQPSEDEARWDGIISRYEFNNLDDFDLSLLEFVKQGVLDADEVARSAHEQNERYVRQLQTGSFESSWRIFHDSFDDNEEEACQSLMNGITNNFDVVSVGDVDGVLTVFKGLGRTDLVDALIAFVAENGSKLFWSTEDFFRRPPQDQTLNDLAAKYRESAKPKLDFEADLVSSAETLNGEKLSQSDASTVALNAEPVSIVLHFVEPVRAVRDGNRAGGDAKLERSRHKPLI